MHTHTHTHTYIYREREREKEREIGAESDIDSEIETHWERNRMKERERVKRESYTLSPINMYTLNISMNKKIFSFNPKNSEIYYFKQNTIRILFGIIYYRAPPH